MIYSWYMFLIWSQPGIALNHIRKIIKMTGHTTDQVRKTFKRYRPKDQTKTIGNANAGTLTIPF